MAKYKSKSKPKAKRQSDKFTAKTHREELTRIISELKELTVRLETCGVKPSIIDKASGIGFICNGLSYELGFLPDSPKSRMERSLEDQYLCDLLSRASELIDPKYLNKTDAVKASEEIKKIAGELKRIVNLHIGAEPIPFGGEPADPGWLLRQSLLDEERFERHCQRNFQELQGWIAKDDKRGQLYKLADKGFQEAQIRRKGKRWPLLNRDKKPAVEKDLSQAVCILFVFHNYYQELNGLADLVEPLINLEIQCKYGAVIGELREDVSYYYGQGLQDEVDIFMACMNQVKQHIGSDGTVSKKPKDEKSSRKKKRKSSAKNTPAQLKRKARNDLMKGLLKENPSLTTEQLAGKLGCNKATVSRSKVWQDHQNSRESKSPKGFKRDSSMEGPDTESITNGPQPEHLDIKQLIEDHGNGAELPTANTIMAKLSLKDEDKAKRLTKETLHFFPEIVKDR